MEHKLNRRTLAKTAGALAGGTALGRSTPALAQEASPAASPATDDTELYQQSPWWPWLMAHIEDEDPPDVIGGPITTTADGVYQTSQPTPFSDQFAALEGASVRSVAVDATATDGATTKDEIDFEATFPAPEDQGTYRVVVQKAAPHGWAYPTGGGVVTDVILHGVTGWGTRLMPTEFTYSAFWGPGDVYHNDELVAEGHGIHMMLTEYVRENPYDLVFDEGVDPSRRHLHLMALPFTLKGEQAPLPTGYMLPNGMEQPFLHVMFPGVSVERTMGQ